MHSFASSIVLMLIAGAVLGQATPQEEAAPSPQDAVQNRIRGTRWRAYGEQKSDPPDAVYQLHSFDASRVTHLSNGNYRVWLRHDFSSTQAWTYGIVHNYDWIIEQQEVKCTALETMTLRRLLYKQITDTEAQPNWDWTARLKSDFEWETQVPDSYGETLLKLLCGQLRAYRNR